jgi:hypothetical protein
LLARQAWPDPCDRKFRAGREGSGRFDNHQFIAALGKPRLYE